MRFFFFYIHSIIFPFISLNAFTFNFPIRTKIDAISYDKNESSRFTIASVLIFSQTVFTTIDYKRINFDRSLLNSSNASRTISLG